MHSSKTEQSVQPNFNLLMRVRYAECDAQQVVFNARYADYIDIAMTEYFRILLGGFQRLIDNGVDNQVVSMHIDWQSSAAFDDVLNIRVSPSKVGNTSYSYNLHIKHHETQRVIAIASIVYVMVDTEHYQKTPVPNWLRSKLQQSATLGTVDQTGTFNKCI